MATSVTGRALPRRGLAVPRWGNFWGTAVEEAGMSTGVFSLVCPQCGADLRTGEAGVEACSGCGVEYVERFGYLFRRTVVTKRSSTIAGGSDTSPN
jgi:hypothetical protein